MCTLICFLRPVMVCHPQVWGYFSVKSGGGIHEYSDSQVGVPREGHVA
jgi:hypothetical protein